jgi:uncharacterized membrane protein YgcG
MRLRAIFTMLSILTALSFLLFTQARAELSYTNGFYKVYVDDTTDAPGTYNFATGPSHPVPNQNILYKGSRGDAVTSYITIRSYTTNTDYVSRRDAPSTTPGFSVSLLRNFPYTITSLPNGFNVTWNVNAPDSLRVEHIVTITGTTLSDSLIRQSIRVTNTGTSPVTIGIRLMLDLMIAENDDALIKRVPGDATFINTFFVQPPPPITFNYFEFTDRPNTFSVFGTVQGTPQSPPPTPPTLFYFSDWPSAYDNAWTFTVSGCCSDSAVSYFWGDNSSNAITINPGQTYEVITYMTTQPAAVGAPGGGSGGSGSGGSSGGSGSVNVIGSGSGGDGGGCSMSYGASPLNALAWLLIPAIAILRRVKR